MSTERRFKYGLRVWSRQGSKLILPQSIVHGVDHLIIYLQDIFDLTNSSKFEEGVFQTYLNIGRSIRERLTECEETKSLSEKLDAELNYFNVSWQLSTGLSMELLWRLFKPSLAKNLEQLESRVGVKQFADRFDAIKWMTGASIRDLDLLRWSIIDLHDTIGSGEIETNEKTKV